MSQVHTERQKLTRTGRELEVQSGLVVVDFQTGPGIDFLQPIQLYKQLLESKGIYED